GFSILINNGGDETSVRTVNLTLSAGDDTEFVELSENSLFIGPISDEPGKTGFRRDLFKPTMTYVLTDDPGEHTIYARFYTSSLGTPSETVSDDIILIKRDDTPERDDTVTLPPLLTQEMDYGAAGDEVSRLQMFLAEDPSLYPEDQVTGFFGSLTREAVKRFQCKHQIICEGDPLPGYGRVGPSTLKKLNELIQAKAKEAPPSSPKETEIELELEEDIEVLETRVQTLQRQTLELLNKIIETLQRNIEALQDKFSRATKEINAFAGLLFSVFNF
ncbi:MAG: peptidoglycan-binding protein, partial [Patescibacteria group bacterium]|nr:peptidoglycan-binding protein [Patescibacteria group bacterium]